MNARERILAAMAWEEPDRVPLTIYDWMLPRGVDERTLRRLGVGIITRLPAHRVEHRQVRYTTTEYWEGGLHMQRRTIETPVGAVHQVAQLDAAYGSTWIREHYIKAPDDYRVMEFVWRDVVFHDNLAAIRLAQRLLGGDGLVMVRVAKGPLLEMLYQMMGYERFSIDLYECPDLVDSLYHTMLRRYEELYALAAETPAEILQAADNITADVVGRARFQRYCVAEYARWSAILAVSGKRLAVHMDGRLGPLVDAIAAAPFQIVEALTPTPVGDLSVAQARQAWPDKALWLNFTSSVHLEPDEAIRAHTRQLIAEAGSKRGFAIGI
ncbi:MAG: uroporphyrinogen decarboxylase family protein, partial [Chloroflexota bacterium]